MMRFSLCSIALFLCSAIAAPASSTSSAPAAQSTACGDIVNNEDTVIFNASFVYDCLTSVPFNPAVATRFLEYYNDTLQFQSTLEYLKNPPSSYQQPGVDLLEGLNQLQQAISNGIFPNQYEFEAALQTLLYAAHDSHVNLIAGILAAFSFASPYDVVSVSVDGIQLPKIYLADDVSESDYFTAYQPSAIKAINGEDAVEYLTNFAAKNSIGTLEPHADWNQLMLSPAQDVQGIYDVFSGGTTFYPGPTLTFLFENGTTITDNYLAIYNGPGPTGPLETGGDFYNFFVLGYYPANFDPDDDDSDSGDNSTTSAAAASSTAAATSATSSTAPTPSSWNSPYYPEVPDVAQPDLGTLGGGFVSGYFLNSTSIAVLSIPSFDEYGEALDTFHNTTAHFIAQSKAAGLTKVVIDLQQNTGGQVLLAFDTFKQFFPNIDPFGGSRMRAHASADVMGSTITDYWNTLDDTDENYWILAASEWVATDRLNAETNQNFTSWAEFYGPHLYNEDNFTTTQRYNLSSVIFDEDATDDEDVDFAVYGYGAEPATTLTAPYAASDIIILSDGICDSSCALFMEMMHHEAGVKVVVAGGRPTTGPMQSPSGSRGAREYSTYTLDANIEFTQEILELDNSTDVYFLPNRTEAIDVYVTYADINLRDQVRDGETTPLQFAYEAADCRIFFTPQTVFNYSALWQYAADAIWAKPSLCVAGSTGYATTGTNSTDLVGPSSSTPGTYTNISTHLSALNTSSLEYLVSQNDGLEDGNFLRNAVTLKACGRDGTCGKGFACQNVDVCQSGRQVSTPQCVPTCNLVHAPCGGGSRCQAFQATSRNIGSQRFIVGVCPPTHVSQKCGTQSVGRVVVGPGPARKRDA